MAEVRGLLDDSAQITPEYRIAPSAAVNNWTAQQEAAFQQQIQQSPWFQQFTQQYGEQPNLNSPDYNYRAAWQAGVMPELYPYDQTYHWPSVTQNGYSLKAQNHPTAWMEDYMQVTGRDPHEGGMLSVDQIKAISKALRYRYGGK